MRSCRNSLGLALSSQRVTAQWAAGAPLEAVPAPGRPSITQLDMEVTANHPKHPTNSKLSPQHNYPSAKSPKYPCGLSTSPKRRKCEGWKWEWKKGPVSTTCSYKVPALTNLIEAWEHGRPLPRPSCRAEEGPRLKLPVTADPPQHPSHLAQSPLHPRGHLCLLP